MCQTSSEKKLGAFSSSYSRATNVFYLPESGQRVILSHGSSDFVSVSTHLAKSMLWVHFIKKKKKKKKKKTKVNSIVLSSHTP